jgi:outer membrane protein OmpA-like peptidoglycan-associated protein
MRCALFAFTPIFFFTFSDTLFAQEDVFEKAFGESFSSDEELESSDSLGEASNFQADRHVQKQEIDVQETDVIDTKEEAQLLESDSTDVEDNGELSERGELSDRFNYHNTLRGPIGGLHVVDAGSAIPGTFRLSLATDFFLKKNYILEGDRSSHLGARISLSWSAHSNIEAYASLESFSNQNDQGVPELYQTLGDFFLGIKGFARPLPWLALGGDASVNFLNGVGETGLSLKGTSFGLSANASADFRSLPGRSIPLITRLNLQYWFDNSAKLIEEIEDARYTNLSNAAPKDEEDRHLLNPIERFGLNVNRVDTLRLGIGLEAPFEVSNDFWLQPILEWNWWIPSNRQAYSCLIVPQAREGVRGLDSCLEEEGPSSFPMTATLGLRVLPPVKGLGIQVGASIALRGQSVFVRELAPTAPYSLLLALSYAYDPRTHVQTVIEKEPEIRVVERVPSSPLVGGKISGKIVSQENQEPIGDVVIRFRGQDYNALLSNQEGSFESPLLSVNQKVVLELSHPEYLPSTCSVRIPGSIEERQEERQEVSKEENVQEVFLESSVEYSFPDDPDHVANEKHHESDLIESSVEEAFEPRHREKEKAEKAIDANQENNALQVDIEKKIKLKVIQVLIECEMEKKPQAKNLQGKILSVSGKPLVGAQIHIKGLETKEALSDQHGEFHIEKPRAGVYQVQVDAEGYLLRRISIQVKESEESPLEIRLEKKPARSLVQVRKKGIFLRQSIHFARGSANLLERSAPVLSEIADVLLRNPDIKKVEIQGHTDDRGGRSRNLELSQKRAEVIREKLILKGVEAARLEARGYGQSRPLAPNITSANRAKNRRVSFVIRDRSDN